MPEACPAGVTADRIELPERLTTPMRVSTDTQIASRNKGYLTGAEAEAVTDDPVASQARLSH